MRQPCTTKKANASEFSGKLTVGTVLNLSG